MNIEHILNELERERRIAKFIDLYKRHIDHDDENVRRHTAETLSSIRSINPELFIEFFENEIKSEDIEVKRGTFRGLGVYAGLQPVEAVRLYGEGMRDDDYKVRNYTAEALYALGSIDIDKFFELSRIGRTLSSQTGNIISHATPRITGYALRRFARNHPSTPSA